MRTPGCLSLTFQCLVVLEFSAQKHFLTVLRHYRLAMVHSSRSMWAGPESRNHLRVKQGSPPD